MVAILRGGCEGGEGARLWACAAQPGSMEWGEGDALAATASTKPAGGATVLLHFIPAVFHWCFGAGLGASESRLRAAAARVSGISIRMVKTF